MRLWIVAFFVFIIRLQDVPSEILEATKCEDPSENEGECKQLGTNSQDSRAEDAIKPLHSHGQDIFMPAFEYPQQSFYPNFGLTYGNRVPSNPSLGLESNYGPGLFNMNPSFELGQQQSEQDTESQQFQQIYKRSCVEAFNGTDGIYTIQPDGQESFQVYCFSDRDTSKSAWTAVIIRRDGGCNFDRSLDEYSKGFCDLSQDHFLGLNLLNNLTSSVRHELWIQVRDGKNTEDVRYDRFAIGNSNEGYILHTLGNRVEKKNSLSVDNFRTHMGNRFSTKTQDYTSEKCATKLKAGWWFYENSFIDDHDCADTYLTAKYEKGSFPEFTYHNMDVTGTRVKQAHMAIRSYTEN